MGSDLDVVNADANVDFLSTYLIKSLLCLYITVPKSTDKIAKHKQRQIPKVSILC